MKNGLIVGLIITGVLILYVIVLIGIIYLAVIPYTSVEGFNINPTYSKITIPPNNNDNIPINIINTPQENIDKTSQEPIIHHENNPLVYSTKNMTNDDNVNCNTNIIIKDKKHRIKLNCDEFNDKYCKSSLNINNMCCEDTNLYISVHYTDRLPLKHAVHNINLANMKKTDIIFINNANIKYESNVIDYRESKSVNFPRINVDSDNLNTQSELSGYYTYSSYIESDCSQSFIGVSTDSIFISEPEARKELYYKKTDFDGYYISMPIRMTSGPFAGHKLRLINIYKFYDNVNKYVSLQTFKVIQYIFKHIYDNFNSDILIISGYFGLRNELIQLAMTQSNLNGKMILYPCNKMITVSNFEGCSNPDAILLDRQLINNYKVKVLTNDPWFYDNNNHYILTVILENFKDKNYENSKEIARSNWNILHNNNDNNKNVFTTTYEIPLDFVNSEIDNFNIRDNPIISINEILN
ncbi:unknown similar to AMEV141 [Choristoneura biennis entomopoxvirus]|uniref:Uncharacterized protein n=1 Tax=Choristoneura biennis entomopoxvirus TaxID=10288 RepID=A0A916KPP3_CBEPV|nr:unknown similar to AMEV141 [Choristoneura biennis entomopoxvirus]CCU55759.1 unknown similar to AMEV141 [Choristoneura biennis entomopoxvirus]